MHPIVSFGAPITLQHGASSIVISVGGPVSISGSVKDDVVSIGAPIYLHPSTEVRRDVLSLGESSYRAPGVKVTGRIDGQMASWNNRGSPGDMNWILATWQYSGLGLAAGLALLMVCICIAVAFPWQTVLVANHLRREVIRSFVAGLMGVFLFAFLVVPLGLSLFGLPFALLIAVGAAAAWLLGITSFAVVLGKRLAVQRRHDAGLLWTVVSGMFILAVAGAVPWLGIIVVGLSGTTGAGALVLTMVARSRPAHVDGSRAFGEVPETFSLKKSYIPTGGSQRLSADED